MKVHDEDDEDDEDDVDDDDDNIVCCLVALYKGSPSYADANADADECVISPPIKVASFWHLHSQSNVDQKDS